MAHRVSRRIEALEFDGLADLDDVTRANAAIHIRNSFAGVFVRNDFRTRGIYDALVATRVVGMLMRVEDLRDRPATLIRHVQTLREVERVYRQRLASLRAGDQVVEITVGIAGPDLFDNHCCASLA